MFLAIVTTDIDMSRLDEAVAGIEGVKDRLRGAPGFVGALWLKPEDGAGLMMSHWDTEEQARAATPPEGFSPAPGVTINGVRFREIIATASATS